jgi:hypothetical protein
VGFTYFGEDSELMYHKKTYSSSTQRAASGAKEQGREKDK